MLDDCLLPFTGTTGGAALLGLALLLIVGGMVLLLAVRRKRKNAALVLVIPALLGALLLANTPAPAYANDGSECVEPQPTTSVSPSAPTAPTPSPSATPTSSPSTSPTPTPTPTVDPTTDSDGDALPDEVETRFGSDPKKADTDADGLTDAEEATVGTDPTKSDTDDNGVRDPEDDLDADGLTNRQELTLGTQAFNPDTDGDGLTDGDEASRATDPLNADTDSDGVNDFDEVTVGSDPLKADADQVIEHAIAPENVPASLLARGTPSALAATTVTQAPVAEFGDIAGVVGTPVIVNAADGLEQGTLTLSFDPATVPSGTNLAIMHFDEETGAYDQPIDQSIDLASGTATVTTTHFSPFIIVDIDQFNEIWKNEIVVPRDGTGTAQSIDAVLSIDGSGSMSWNDPAHLRFDAASIFVDSLLPGDQVSVVGFDDSSRVVQSLTSDFAAAKRAIPDTYTDGGTSISAAVQGPLDELNANGDPKHSRIIVLLTDGQGNYDSSLTTQAKDSKTTIYTVGLGSETDVNLLDGIATETGGKFFHVENADGLKDAYTRIGGDLGKPDSDGDGLSDEAEINGWHTKRGNVYKTLPDNPDTDGDGLSDGLEAGRLISVKIGYEGVSSPTTKHTDSDGIEDGDEYYLGLNPLTKDTDGDTLDDNVELDFGSDPTDRNPDGDAFNDKAEYDRKLDPLAYDLGSDVERWQVLWAGFLWGEYTDQAKQFNGLKDQQVQSTTYLVGWTASGVAVFGDIRDLYKNVIDGDSLGALLNTAALIPLAGDTAKLGVQVAKFAKTGSHAAKSAGRYIDALPLSQAAKKGIQKQVFGAGARVFPQALEGGPAVTKVYLRIDLKTGKADYVGITKDIIRRQNEHAYANNAAYRLEELTVATGPLTRGQARAVEQAIIDFKGGVKSKGGLYENARNSISSNHAYYQEAKDWGNQWLQDNLSREAKDLLGMK